MSFIIDIYRGQIKPTNQRVPISDFLGFIAMFPRFIAGPIARYKQIETQYHRYKGVQVERGLLIFIYGLCLKVLFADQFAVFVPNAFGDELPSLSMAWIGVISFTMQIYFDFLGYSTMAVGLGYMLGFEFPQNFNRPYLAVTITDFWRRWHMTLSAWLRDYVYIPLGGNRKSKWRTYFNIFITMSLGGLWHGAGWTFLLWGMWHGLFLCAEKFLSKRVSVPKGVRALITFLIVIIGWVFFKSENRYQIKNVLMGLAGLNGISGTSVHIPPMTATLAIAGLIFCLFGEGLVNERLNGDRPVIIPIKVAATAALLLAIVLLLGAQSVPFLYFQF